METSTPSGTPLGFTGKLPFALAQCCSNYRDLLFYEPFGVVVSIL